VAVDLIREQDTVAEISSKYEVHRTMLTRWKKEALEGLPSIFSTAKKKNKQDDQKLIDELYKQNGQLKVENDWLKKKVDTIGF
jgi:transposase-like protein